MMSLSEPFETIARSQQSLAFWDKRRDLPSALNFEGANTAGVADREDNECSHSIERVVSGGGGVGMNAMCFNTTCAALAEECSVKCALNKTRVGVVRGS